jgi:hypothetical protein
MRAAAPNSDAQLSALLEATAEPLDQPPAEETSLRPGLQSVETAPIIGTIKRVGVWEARS